MQIFSLALSKSDPAFLAARCTHTACVATVASIFIFILKKRRKEEMEGNDDRGGTDGGSIPKEQTGLD